MVAFNANRITYVGINRIILLLIFQPPQISLIGVLQPVSGFQYLQG